MGESGETGRNIGLDGMSDLGGFLRRITRILSGRLGQASQIRDQGMFWAILSVVLLRKALDAKTPI
jgi:hypothetical protein